MKKFLVIFFLSTYLVSTTELSQLLKVPVLISHFVEHTAENNSMTFVDYMVHHYGGHEQDEDWETDMKLPFMQHSDVLNVLVIPANMHFNLQQKVPLRSIPEQCTHYRDGDIPNSYLSAIWQPPKFS